MAPSSPDMTGRDAIRAVCADAGLREVQGWPAYLDLARDWAARTDLTSATSTVELAEVLFLDAAHLIAARWIRPATRITDVGAGVGAPLLPILLAEPSIRGTLVEPRRIRATFLRTAIGTLRLEGRATVVERRVNPEAPSVEGSPFDVALSRATFSPEQWLPIGAQLASEVWVLTAGTEVTPTKRLRLARRLDYAVPSTGAPRSVFAFRRR